MTLDNVFVFIPKAGATAKQNYVEFMALCRGSLAFEACRQFDQDVWDVTSSMTGVHRSNIFYTRYEHQADGTLTTRGRTPLSEPVKTFAKSYLTYLRANGHVPNVSKLASVLAALRFLELAYRMRFEGVPVYKFNGELFQATVPLIVENSVAGRAALTGQLMQQIVDFINDKKLTEVPVAWKNPIKVPPHYHELVGEQGDIARAKKLPSRTAIDGICKLFHQTHSGEIKDEKAKLATATCAILMAAPSRVNELLLAPCNIEVENFSSANAGYKLRWFPEKGGAPLTKEVPSALVDTVKLALTTLKESSKQGRKVAKWYESNPNGIYYYPDVAHLAKRRLLTKKQVMRIYYGRQVAPNAMDMLFARHGMECVNKASLAEKSGPIQNFYRREEVEAVLDMTFNGEIASRELVSINNILATMKAQGHQNAKVKRIALLNRVKRLGLRQVDLEDYDLDDSFPIALYRRDDLEKAIRSLLPPHFPYFDTKKTIRFSDMLFVQSNNETLFNVGAGCRAMFYLYTITSLVAQLTGNGSAKSIFMRHGMVEPDGSPIRLTTHQFRHWINTLLQTAGLSEVDIALLSGRKDVRQNKVYNHLTSEQRVELLRTSLMDNQDQLEGYVVSDAVIPMTKVEYAAQKIPAVHLTDFGACFHDYSQEPCQLHRDCLMCNDHVCVKGDAEAERRLDEKLKETQRLLNEAKDAMTSDVYGADHWVLHNAKLIERMTQMLAKLRDAAIPDGAILHMRNDDAPSRLRAALEQRVHIGLDYHEGLPNEAKGNAKLIEDFIAQTAPATIN